MCVTIQALIDRCNTITWTARYIDRDGIELAYRRWQTVLGVAHPVRIVTDPQDIDILCSDPGFDRFLTQGIEDFWIALAGSPVVRALRFRAQPGFVLPPFAPEWDYAVAWACALSTAAAQNAAWSGRKSDLRDAHAALYDKVGGKRPLLKAMSMVGAPFCTLFDPPPRIVATLRDVLTAVSNDGIWRQMVEVSQDDEFACVLNSDPITLGPSAERDDVIAALISVAEPMLAACESGAFLHTFDGDEFIVLASPQIWTDGRRLHRSRAPALEWPNTRIYAWKGCVLPRRFILEPDRITAREAWALSDPRAQRAVIDLFAHTYGHPLCMREFGGSVIGEDALGRLWSIETPAGARITTVEVDGIAPQPNSAASKLWIDGPPEAQTPHEAVAWAFNRASRPGNRGNLDA